MSRNPKKMKSAQKVVAVRSSKDRGVILAVCISLLAMIWMVFGQTGRFEFVNFDDNINVYWNADIAKGLTLEGIGKAFTHTQVGHWDPVTTLSHMVCCQLFGLEAGGHHLVNVLLHTAAAVLLFLVLRDMTGALWRSAFVAAVFAIHPLRAESVAWVTERKDVLSGVFFMLTLGAYVRYVRQPKSLARYLAVLLLFALGLMSKSMLVTLPFVLLLLDFWPLNRFAHIGKSGNPFTIARRVLVEKMPFLALSAISCVVTLLSAKKDIELMPLSLSLRLSNVLVSYVTYIGRMFYPAHLAVFYPYPINGLPPWEISLSLMLLTSISGAAFILRKKHPWLLVGWLWYLGVLMPVNGLIQGGWQANADRYTYLPQIGLYLIVAWAVAETAAAWRYRRFGLSLAITFTLVALMVFAKAQTSCWRNSESLWNRAIAVTVRNSFALGALAEALAEEGRMNEAISDWEQSLAIEPNNTKSHIDLGGILLAKGQVDAAIPHFLKALEIDPEYSATHANLGIALMQKGQVDEAIAHCKKALEINPDNAEAHSTLGNAYLNKGRMQEAMIQYQKAVEIRPGIPQAQHNLAGLLFMSGRIDEAIIHDQKAVEFDPDYAQAHNNLGIALLQKERVAEAVVHFQKAVRLQPNYAEAHYHLGKALMKKAEVREAIAQWQKVFELEPSNSSALNEMAWILATCPDASIRNGSKAIELAQKANQLAGGNDPAILDTLASACAEAGRFAEAVEAAKRAEQMAEASGNSELVHAIQSRIKLYNTNTPFRDTGLVNASSSQP